MSFYIANKHSAFISLLFYCFWLFIFLWRFVHVISGRELSVCWIKCIWSLSFPAAVGHVLSLHFYFMQLPFLARSVSECVIQLSFTQWHIVRLTDSMSVALNANELLATSTFQKRVVPLLLLSRVCCMRNSSFGWLGITWMSMLQKLKISLPLFIAFFKFSKIEYGNVW